MDKGRRKELRDAYKNRSPEMGVISYRCKETGEVFLAASKDIKADFNSTTVKLSSGWHPNKRLLELWQKYGEEGFELSVVKKLKYDNPNDDHTEKLESMRDEIMMEDPKARRIWK